MTARSKLSSESPRMRDTIKDVLAPLRHAVSRWIEGSVLGTMFDRYRPERHYMRGTGPKSRTIGSGHDADSKGT